MDDEPQVLVALEDLLCDDFVIFKAESAQGALELVQRRHDIAVVVTDQRMPRITGDELLSRLPLDCDALRILVTGFADLSGVIRAVNDGRIFAYVTKPWNPDDLRLKVSKAAEHFRLTQELRNERQLLYDLMDNIPDGIYFKDRERRFLRANRALARIISDGDPADLVGRRLEEVLPACTYTDVTTREEIDILSDGKPVQDAVREYRREGARRWLSETKAPIRDALGVAGLVGVSRDVTERVGVDEALRTSEESLRKHTQILNTILDSMGDGVVVADHSGSFLLFNAQAEKILGFAPAGVSARDWTNTYGIRLPNQSHPISVDRDPLSRAIAGEVVPETEVLISNHVVTSATVAMTASPLIDATNTISGGVVLLRDITGQRELERQLFQSQKMEVVGQLAGGIAHDFNNLLAVIQSYGELLRLGLPSEDSRRQDVDEVLAATRRAAALTRQLLAFSRRQMVQPKPLQLNEVVGGVERMLRRLIGEDIELVARLEPSLGTVLADAGQLEQIIVNLTVNARDAMSDGGTLTIETADVVLDAEYAAAVPGVTPGRYVMLAVADNGAGMTLEVQRRVFEPFFTTKEVGKGTGLGLSTVYGIVQQSQGHVRLESEVGRGSCFRLYFPVASSTLVPAELSTTSFPPPAMGCVLLVEDDDALRRVTARILRDNGFSVLEARRPTDARALCAKHGADVDLLLVDVVMPELSGPKLAEELLRSAPRMRVLCMSGYPGTQNAPEGLVGTDVPYIQKPFTPRALVERIRYLLGSVSTAT
ncbi:MAG TPA: response regulator [Polyangiaceae bacterium]